MHRFQGKKGHADHIQEIVEIADRQGDEQNRSTQGDRRLFCHYRKVDTWRRCQDIGADENL